MTDNQTPTTGLSARLRQSPVMLLTGGALALLIVALAVGLAITAVRLRDTDANSSRIAQADAVQSARVTSLAAAKVYAVELASYNYKTLDAGFAAVKAHSTPSFTKTFNKSSVVAETLFSKYKAVSKAQVIAAGLTDCTATQAVALVLLSQTVTSTAKKGASNAESRVSMTLVRDHGDWMIQQVQLLG